MSEPKKNPQNHPEETSVDWAERLKASINGGYTESAETASDDEQDDLAKLLRAQLGMSQERSAYAEALDTSEFESSEDPEDYAEDYAEEDSEEDSEDYDEDDSEEYIEEDSEEYIEEDSEDYAEDDSEDYNEDDSDDYDEDDSEEYIEEDSEDYAEEDSEDYDEEEPEDYDEEYSEDYAEEDSEDYDEEEPEDYDEEYSEDYGEEDSEDYDEEEPEDYDEEDSEDYAEEDPEDYAEEEPEDYDEEDSEDYDEEDSEEYIEEDSEDYDEDDSEEYIEEDSEDYAEEAPEDEPEGVAADSAVDAIRYLSDDRLNGLPFEERMGGARLRSMDEANTRLLEETRPVTPWSDGLADAASDEAVPADADREAGLGRSSDAGERPRETDTIRLKDSLQIDLDSFLPPITPLRKGSSREDLAEPSASTMTEGGELPLEGAPAYAPEAADWTAEEEELRDTEMCLDLGYEEDLRSAEEQARVEQIYEQSEGAEALESASSLLATETDPAEMDPAEVADAERAYSRARRTGLIRIGIALVGLLWGILYDLLPLAPASFGTQALWDTAFYAPIGLLLTVLLWVPFMTRLAKGLKGLVTFAPTRYSVAAMSGLVTLLYGVVACIVADPQKVPLLLGGGWLPLAVAALADFWVGEGERKAFSVASSGKLTFMLTSEPTPASAECARQPEESADAGRPKAVLTAVRAGRVADFGARAARYNPYAGRWNYMLPVALLVAILCAGTAMLLGEEPLIDGARTFAVAYLLCIPSAYALSLALPLRRVNEALHTKGAAVIGAAAPADYADAGTTEILFPDGDAVKAIYRKEITLRGDPRAAELRDMAGIVFRMLHMPLGVEPVMGERSLEGYRIHIAEADEQYLRLYLTRVDTQVTTEIMMGPHEALTRRGVRLPKINMEQRYKKNEKCHVLYLAFDRSFHLAYAVEYRVGLTFARTVAALADRGQSASIYTYDPMVHAEIEGIALLQKRSGIRVLSPTVYEGYRKARSSGVIATGRCLDLLYPFAACRAMKQVYRRGLLLSWLSMLGGAALILLTVCLGKIGFLSTIPVVLWQLATAALSVAITLLGTHEEALCFRVTASPRSREEASE